MSIESDVHRLLALRLPGEEATPDVIAEHVRQADPLRPASEVARSVEIVVDLLAGLGPIEPLLRDPAVSDVLINGAGPVWVERRGQLCETDVCLDEGQVALIVERVVAPLGERADPVHPQVQGRLPDGSRVQVLVPPLAVDGPCLAIRRFAAPHTTEVASMTSEAVAALLAEAVGQRCNIVVSGATGSGKTTLLNALALHVPPDQRIITVEDAAELRLGARHVVRLEAREGGIDGPQPVTIRDLLRAALRMRPDRVIVGEVRGAEALDLLMAMNTGHDGSLSTLHANGPADALARLETLVLMADIGLPLSAIRQQIAAAVDLVVQVARDARGRRVIAQVVEVAPEPDHRSHRYQLRTLAHGPDVLAPISRHRVAATAEART